MNLKTKFDSKAYEIDVQPFRIVAVEELDKARWDFFSTHLLADNDTISKFSEDLYVDGHGVTNSLLMLRKDGNEGILVNSEGSNYARYSAYLPFARPYLEYEINRLADYCVTEGCGNTSDGLWAISFDELWEHFDIPVTRQNGLASMLVEELNNREEVEQAKLDEDEIELSYHLQFCPNCNPGILTNQNEFSLLSLLGCTLEDVQFCCLDSAEAVSNIALINEKMITEEGKREWADVLSAKVEGISYVDGILITLSGCSEERLKEFGLSYSDFDESQNTTKWFCSPDEPMPSPLTKNYEVIDDNEFELRYAKHVLWLNDIEGGECADFSNCVLSRVNMSNRKLSCANFQNAFLECCNLDGCDLGFSSFTGAFLDRCTLKYTNADEICMKDATLKNTDLSYILLMHGNFARSHFYRCDLFNGNIKNSCFEDTQFTHTKTDVGYIDVDDDMTDEEWTNSPDGQVMRYES